MELVALPEFLTPTKIIIHRFLIYWRKTGVTFSSFHSAQILPSCQRMAN